MKLGTASITFLIVTGMVLLVVGATAIYTYIENYIDNRHARKNKVVLRLKTGKQKVTGKLKMGRNMMRI